jgi:hypothetical protein
MREKYEMCEDFSEKEKSKASEKEAREFLQESKKNTSVVLVQYNDSSLTVEVCRDEKVHDLELSELTPKQLGDLVQCMYANTTDLLVDPIQTHWNLGLYKKLISANSGPKLFSPSQRLYPTRTVAVYYTTLPKIPLPRIFFFCPHKREREFKLVTSDSLSVVPID